MRYLYVYRLIFDPDCLCHLSEWSHYIDLSPVVFKWLDLLSKLCLKHVLLEPGKACDLCLTDCVCWIRGIHAWLSDSFIFRLYEMSLFANKYLLNRKKRFTESIKLPLCIAEASQPLIQCFQSKVLQKAQPWLDERDCVTSVGQWDCVRWRSFYSVRLHVLGKSRKECDNEAGTSESYINH